MDNSDYLQYLDKALEYLNNNLVERGTFIYYDEPRAKYNNQDNYLFKHFRETKVEEKYWYPIIYHLYEDKYIDFAWEGNDRLTHNHPNQLKITFRGIMFINDLGYSGEVRRLAVDEKATSDANYRAEKYAKRLNLWTKTLTFATIVAALIIVSWEVFKTFWIEHPDLHIFHPCY